ncbi:MAG: glycosyl hydrolase [Imperialibacter sp.]|uniref:glycosyl hydrolase n=1 Tax=Imperialibacter sp. TaxID=2038411 RepID=UPI0032EC1C9F
MKTRFLTFIALGLFVCLQCNFAVGQSASAYEQVKSAFQTPPQGARPKVYWWWLNGNVDSVRVKEEIAAMDRAGLSGFDLFETGVPPVDTMVEAGPAFLSKESLKVIKAALDEAKKRNMEVGFNMASSWNAGGTWVTPENSAKSIYDSRIEVKGKSGGNIKLPFPEISKIDAAGKTRVIQYQRNGKPVFYQEVAVVAIPLKNGKPDWDPAKIVDVSSQFDPESEKLNWTLTGDWEVHRYICSNSGEQLKRPSKYSSGPIIDHFDAQATEAHFLHIINVLAGEMGDLRNTALKSLYLASYEATGFTWTTALPDVFKALTGYEINTFLPVLLNQSSFEKGVVEKFMKDYQRTLSELMITNFYKKAREVANAHGLKINSEAGGPGMPMHNVPAEPLKALGALDLPRGEFWINYNAYNDQGVDFLRVVKEVSSASHIYGRGIVEEEAFTSSLNWQEGPFDMKPTGDRAFCEGMNRVVVHGFSHNPSGIGYPGIVYHAGTHFNDKRIWHPKIRPFTDYLARVSAVFQQTDFVADVLYYYGDAVPNYAGPKNGRFMAGLGYDYDVINTEILLQLKVKDGKLVLPTGGQYNLLALEDEGDINPAVLLKIDELVSAGATITGAKPKKVSDRPGGTPAMAAMIDKVWNQNSKAKVVAGKQPSEVLQANNIGPDINYSDIALNTLDYIHYNKNGLDFYFVRNTTDEWVSREISFRQQARVPEIWDPINGSVSPATIYNQSGQYIQLPVSLPPMGSAFVVFKPGKPSQKFSKITGTQQHPPMLNYTPEGVFVMEAGAFEVKKQDQSSSLVNNVHVKTLTGAWEVFFSPEWGGPERRLFPELSSWTDSEEEDIKYYSGIARYKKPFYHDVNVTLMKDQRVFLDLGDLSKVGEVWLNGEPLGITWAKPYRFDITDKLKAGNNLVEVEIANVWANRIIGDARTDGKDYTYSNVLTTTVVGFGRQRFSWEETPLVESGLLGPVRLITVSPL